MTLKPEAFKSNNPGYVRGKLTHNFSTPERVEVEHHKTISFKDELIRLLKENDVDYKEEHLFT